MSKLFIIVYDYMFSLTFKVTLTWRTATVTVIPWTHCYSVFAKFGFWSGGQLVTKHPGPLASAATTRLVGIGGVDLGSALR